MDYLLNFERKPSNFYDTHYVQVENVINLACLTHSLSDLIDILLCPLTKRVKSYLLRDTTDFLNHLHSAVPGNTLLASFDVESLYSNIPHELGIEAIKYWLRKYPNYTPSRFPPKNHYRRYRVIIKK